MVAGGAPVDVVAEVDAADGALLGGFCGGFGVRDRGGEGRGGEEEEGEEIGWEEHFQLRF